MAEGPDGPVTFVFRVVGVEEFEVESSQHFLVVQRTARLAGSILGCPQDPKKEKKKEMGHSRSQHFVLASRDIESVTRRVGRWGFSKVYPWNGRIQP